MKKQVEKQLEWYSNPNFAKEEPAIFWNKWSKLNEQDKIKNIAQLVPIIRQSLVDDQTIPMSSASLLNSYFQDLERTIKNGGEKNGSVKRSKKQTKSKKGSIPRPKKRL